MRAVKEQIALVAREALDRGSTLLLTRLDPAQHVDLPESIRAALDHDPISRTAWLGDPPGASGPIAA